MDLYTPRTPSKWICTHRVLQASGSVHLTFYLTFCGKCCVETSAIECIQDIEFYNVLLWWGRNSASFVYFLPICYSYASYDIQFASTHQYNQYVWQLVEGGLKQKLKQRNRVDVCALLWAIWNCCNNCILTEWKFIFFCRLSSMLQDRSICGHCSHPQRGPAPCPPPIAPRWGWHTSSDGPPWLHLHRSGIDYPSAVICD